MPYEQFSSFEHMCKEKQISILDTKFQETVKVIIEVTKIDKEAIYHEITKKQLNLQNVKVIEEKYIHVKSDKKQ